MTAVKVFLVLLLPCLVKGQPQWQRYFDLAENTHGIVWWINIFTPDGMSEQCKDDLNHWADHIYNGTDWAFIMADAWGHPDPGYLLGDTVWEGRYEMCREADTGGYKGKIGAHYCLATWAGILINDGLGVCMPRSCNETDINQYLVTGGRTEQLIAPPLFPAWDDDDRPVRFNCVVPMSEKRIGDDPSAVAAIVILSLFGFLVVIATFIHEVRRRRAKKAPNTCNTNGIAMTNGHVGQDNKAFVGDQEAGKPAKVNTVPPQPNIILRFLLCFSILDHVPQMLSFKHPKGSLRCLNGIRSLTFLWILMGHTFQLGVYITAPFVPTIANKFMIFRDTAEYQLVNMMEMSVETFFLMSGMLTTISLMKKLEREKKPQPRTMGLYYFHRFWRLTPVYMLVLMFYGCLFHYIGEGPFYWDSIPDADGCRDVWWRHLLYINNIFNYDGSDCMGWSWYLANDFQFYLVAPIFIFALFYLPVFGILLSIGGVAGSMVALAVLSAAEWEGKVDGYWDIYVTPWTRASTYFIGILLGYTLWKLKCKAKKVHWLLVILGWFVSMAGMWICVYLTYFVPPADAGSHVAWQTLRRPLFGACVAWIIFACITGYGGFVNAIMSWHGWIPIAKLSYVGYLVHPIIIYYYYYRNPIQHYVSNWNDIYLVLGNALLVLGISFIVSLCLEVPFADMEKIMFPNKKPAPKLKNSQEGITIDGNAFPTTKGTVYHTSEDANNTTTQRNHYATVKDNHYDTMPPSHDNVGIATASCQEGSTQSDNAVGRIEEVCKL